MAIITILIASAIAAGVSFLFRQLDKDNNSMEKVKKFTSLRIEEFDNYFQEKQRNLVAAGAEIDTKQQQAAAAVKRLEKQLDDFHQMAEGLQKDINSVQNIEAKLKGYDNSIGTLSDMTSKVEENLLRLKKESLIIEKLDTQLSSQKKNLDDVEKHIPQVSASFAEKNSEQLKTIGNRLLDEYDVRAQKLSDELGSVHKEAEDMLERVRSEVAGIYSEAAKKAEELEDAAFKHLSEQAQKRSDQYIADMNAKAAEIEKQLDACTAEAEKHADDSISAIEDKAAGIERQIDARVAEAQKHVDDRSAEIDDAVAGLESGLDSRYKDKIGALEDQINGKIEAVQKQADGRADELDEKLSSQYLTIAAKHTQKADETAAVIDKKYAELADKYTQKSAELDTTLEQKTSEVASQLKETAGNVVANLKKSLSSLDEKYKQHIDEFGTKYTEKLSQLQTKYSSQLDSIDGKNDGRIAELDKKFSDTYAKLSDDYAKKSAAVEQQAASVKNMYDEKVGTVVADINTRISELDDQYRKQMTDLRTQLDTSLTETKKTADYITQNTEGNTKSLEGLKSSLETQLRDISARYSVLFEDAVSKADEKEKAALEKFTAAADANTEKYHAAIQAKIDTFKTSLTDALKTVAQQASESVKDAQSSVKQLQNECDEAEKRADSVAPQLAEKVKAVDDEIEKFRTQSEEKITQINASIDAAVKKTAAMCELHQTDALKNLDTQLASYKKDLEYRFSRLESSGRDVDTLEAGLRKAMDEIRKRVLSDFDAFTSEQQQKHAEFASSIKADSDGIQTQLAALEKEIDDLKISAIGSVSSRLKDFEDGFNSDLKARGEKMSDDLTSWKTAFDGKLTLFTTDYENERRAVEVKYGEDLKTKLSALQEKNDEQMKRIASGMQEAQNSMDEKIGSMTSIVNSFTADMETRIGRSQSESDMLLKKAAEEYEKKINDQLSKVQAGLLDNLKKFEETVSNRQETSSSTIDAALSEFNTWKQHLKQQLDQSSEMFKEQLDGLKISSQKKMEEAGTALAADMAKYTDGVKKQQDDISTEIAELQVKADESVGMYEQRSKEVLEKLQAMYEDMLRDTEQRVADQNADLTKKVSGLKNEIQSISDTSRENQAKFVLTMQNNANDMQTTLSELSKELQAVKTQMQMYDKAEQMKKQLDEKIANLDGDFSRLDAFGTTAAKLSEQYASICRMNDDISSRLRDFETQKDKVDTIGQKFDKMITLSGTMDEKISGLQTTYDELQNMEVAARDFQEKLTMISGSYDRLEKKQEVIDRVNKDVDASFDNLKQLEERIKSCARQTESLPQEIKDVQKNVDELLKNGPKIGDAVTKISTLHTLLDDADKRMDTINSARQGIGRSEARLQELATSIDSKFKLLHQITQQDLEKHPSKGGDLISPQERENIKSLKQQGWTIDEIAKSMKRTPAEIDLALQL